MNGGVYSDFPVNALPAHALQEDHRGGKTISERIALPEPASTRAARRSRSKISMETSVSSKTMNKLIHNSRRNFLATQFLARLG
jgi:hypothetical protein